MTEVVARRCRDHEGGERSLRTALLDDIRMRVPFAFHVWALTDPETEVATAPLATVPEHLMPQLSGIVRRRYCTTINRWDQLTAPAASLAHATKGDLTQSGLHGEVLGHNGIGDVATVVFRDRFGCWGFVDLWRQLDEAPFSDTEIAVLADDAPAITDALRRCQARGFDDPPPPATAPLPGGPAVLFLSPELAVLGQTPDTDAYLRALLPTDADRQPVPAGAYNVAAALLASEAGIFDHMPVARVRPTAGTWLTFRAARIEGDRPPPEQDIAVTIEVTAPAERRALYVRCHGLSVREAEVLELLTEGADTREVAASLFVSEHTVQDHLKSIFDKTGARNRRTLLARVAGR